MAKNVKFEHDHGKTQLCKLFLLILTNIRSHTKRGNSLFFFFEQGGVYVPMRIINVSFFLILGQKIMLPL